MVLITKNKNKRTKVTSYLYELSNKVKLIHIQNPATIDFSLTVIIKSGASYEDMEKVPHGTAHLLEHILFKPNSKFQSDDEIHTFEEGTRKRPSMYINGRTNFKTIQLIGWANQEATNRVIERIKSLVEFPYDIFDKYFETEKDIVLAEKTQLPKQEKDKTIQLLKFLQEKELPEFSYAVIGEVGDIQRITLKDLDNFFKSRFVTENVTIATQSPSKLNKEILGLLEDLSLRFPERQSSTFQPVNLPNKLDLGCFLDDRMEGTSVFLEYFIEKKEGFDYTEEVTTNLLNSLIKKVGEEILRDKLGLIYGIYTGKSAGLTLSQYIYEIEFSVENHKIEYFMEELEKFLYDYLEEFLNSKRGKDWFEHIISTFIFPHTTNYEASFADNIAFSYIERGELWNSNEFYKAARKITRKQLVDAIVKASSLKPHIWVESNLEKITIEKAIKESKLWKRYSQL